MICGVPVCWQTFYCFLIVVFFVFFPPVSGLSSSHPFTFTELLTFCLSLKAYCPIHLFSNLCVSRHCGYCFLSLLIPAFATILGLLIYKLAAKAWLIPSSPFKQKTERCRDSGGKAERQERERWATIWFASQKRMTQRIWMSASSRHWFAYLWLRAERMLVYLFE